ncbi:MAG: sn-glycerol-1-phosphate dehydrogenase [Clostridia bacterium]|nr:sn-glycerol-1-phosphate dehydrogenase [Clostridia bacterium]
MDFEKLLMGRDCECGMKHTCSIKHIIIGKNANQKLSGLLGDYKKILLVADTNTYAACGEAIKAQIGDKLETLLIYQRDGLLIPNEEAVEEMQAKLTAQTDLIVGIGSGVIQDTCKYVSHQAKLPYAIVATAPSMDGYASVGAAMIMGGMKVTYSAHVPEIIIGDIDVLKDAPMDMIKSGYGDILGKYSCLNDWKLARIVRGEYFCPYVYDLTMDMVIKTRDLGEKLLARDAEAIGTLMEAIIGVGVAMAFVGNSRPASGSEHHLSHYFEIVGILRDEEYFMHGTDVVYSSIYTQRIREQLLAIDAPAKSEPLSREKWEENIRRIYGKIADSVIALQDKMGWYGDDRFPVYSEKWNEIKAVLAEAPSVAAMNGYLESIGLDVAEFDALYGEEKIVDALKFAKDLKDRYSVLWMYYDLLVS